MNAMTTLRSLAKMDTSDSHPLSVAAAIHRRAIADFGLPPASEQLCTVAEWTDVMKRVGFEVVAADLLLHADFGPRPILPADESHVRASLPVRGSMKVKNAPAKFRHLREIIHYRRLLARHQDDGNFLETRLFVLRKQACQAEIEISRRTQ